MGWERRPEDATPEAAGREFEDEDGRTWVGMVRSGVKEGGEEHAEVVFTCKDQPSERARVARLDTPPADADDAWRAMGDDERKRLLEGADRE